MSARFTIVGVSVAILAAFGGCIKDASPLTPEGMRLVRSVSLPTPGPNAVTSTSTYRYGGGGQLSTIQTVSTRYSGFNLTDTSPGQATSATRCEYDYVDGSLAEVREFATPFIALRDGSCAELTQACLELRSVTEYGDYDGDGNPRGSQRTFFIDGVAFDATPLRYAFTPDGRLESATQQRVEPLFDTLTGEVVDRVDTDVTTTYGYDEWGNVTSRRVAFSDARIEAQRGVELALGPYDRDVPNPLAPFGWLGGEPINTNLRQSDLLRYIVEDGLLVGIVELREEGDDLPRDYYEYE